MPEPEKGVTESIVEFCVPVRGQTLYELEARAWNEARKFVQGAVTTQFTLRGWVDVRQNQIVAETSDGVPSVGGGWEGEAYFLVKHTGFVTYGTAPPLGPGMVAGTVETEEL